MKMYMVHFLRSFKIVVADDGVSFILMSLVDDTL